MIARDGAIISRWDLPALTLSQEDRPAVAISQGVMLFGNDWTFQVEKMPADLDSAGGSRIFASPGSLTSSGHTSTDSGPSTGSGR